MKTVEFLLGRIDTYHQTQDARVIDNVRVYAAMTTHCRRIMHRYYPDLPHDKQEEISHNLSYYVINKVLANRFHEIENFRHYLFRLVRNQANHYLAEKYKEEERLTALDILEADEILSEEDARTDRPYLNQGIVAETSEFVRQEITAMIASVHTNPFMSHKRDDYVRLVLFCLFHKTDVKIFELDFRSECLIRYLADSTFERISARVNRLRS